MPRSLAPTPVSHVDAPTHAKIVPNTWVLYGIAAAQLSNVETPVVFAGRTSTVRDFLAQNFDYHVRRGGAGRRGRQDTYQDTSCEDWQASTVSGSPPHTHTAARHRLSCA
jgi:hypothetical protein